jgi:hypothetical protein
MTLRAVKFDIDKLYINPIAALAVFDALLNLKLCTIKKKVIALSNSNQTSRGISLYPHVTMPPSYCFTDLLRRQF